MPPMFQKPQRLHGISDGADFAEITVVLIAFAVVDFEYLQCRHVPASYA